ncbi:MAG TPA: hypothetical protein VNE39_28395 [Planctomycetota bacterium]|nr:hypothetical protein [Planctomycetota bacterium]
MGTRLPEAVRTRRAEEARRLYARVLVEHERVRHTEAHAATPSAPLWRPMRELAMFHATGRRRKPLADFCGAFRDADGVPASVPTAAYRAALRVALDLAADQLVQLGGDTPWGRGRSRVPDSVEHFESICRELRDGDASGAIAAILDDAAPPRRGTAVGLPRVVFDVPGKLLTIGSARIPLPEGRELGFLRMLASRRADGEVTPPTEHGTDWKNAADQLRARIRKATGQSLIRAVVTSGKAPVGGYRLAPNVEVVGEREVRLQMFAPEVLERLEGASRRKPRGRDLRGEDDD